MYLLQPQDSEPWNELFGHQKFWSPYQMLKDALSLQELPTDKNRTTQAFSSQVRIATWIVYGSSLLHSAARIIFSHNNM